MILDEKEQVVLANRSLSDLIGKTPKNLIGMKGSELGWLDCHSPKNCWKKSFYCALVTKQLALECGDTASDRLFVMGLLHDLGHLFIMPLKTWSSGPNLSRYSGVRGKASRPRGPGIGLPCRRSRPFTGKGAWSCTSKLKVTKVR